MPPPSLVKTERRTAQRFAVSFDGEYITSTNETSKITVVNISQSGLQFLTEQMNVLTLVPNSGTTNNMSPVSIRLSFDLGFELPSESLDGSTVSPLEIVCGIVYVQRHSMNICVVGCRFEEFLDDASERLSAYLSTHS